MIAATRSYLAEAWEVWNEFWITPTSPTTLSAIRVLAGAMLLYTHLVWSLGLTDFFSQNGWLPQQLMYEVHHDGGDQDDGNAAEQGLVRHAAPKWSERHGESHHVEHEP